MGRQAGNYLEEISRGIRMPDLSVDTYVAGDDPTTCIVRTAEESKANLIAVTTHGFSGFSRPFPGSVADRILHTSTTPLVLLKPTDIGVSSYVSFYAGFRHR